MAKAMRGDRHVSKWGVSLALLAATMLTGCGDAETPNGSTRSSPEDVLAQTIERQVAAQAPEHDLRQYVRLYVRGAEGNIDATYLVAHMGGLPSTWKGGHSYWVASSDVPRVLDGGCAVINVLYHEPTSTLVSVHCNGDA